MLCPSCEQDVSEDAAVCPHCETVLDPSLLDAAPPPDDGDDAPAPPPRRASARPASRPGVKRAAGKPPGARPGVKKKRPAPRRVETPPPAPAAKQDWRSQLSEEDWKEYAVAEKPAFEVDRTLDPEDWMTQTRHYLIGLPLADKIALLGTGLMLMATFFPWRETVTQGDVIGVFSTGILVALMSGGALAGFIIRTRKLMPKLNPLLPWIAQLGLVGVAAVWCLFDTAVLSWDSTPAQSRIGNFTVWVSKPSIGLIVALLSSIVSLVGTILGLKDLGR
jgi:hypothetical protein